MAVKEILRLGNPGLWKVCEPVKDVGAPGTKKIIRDLKDTLEDFKKKNGFGRAIAAPQIRYIKKNNIY